MGGITISKPLIGITTYRQTQENPRSCYGKIGCNYIDAIQRAGGVPLPIPILDDLEETENYLEIIDGLLLTGGQDISPECYGEEPGDRLKKVDISRDRWELEFFRRTYRSDLPVLGICRGMQLINVGLGGTLYQDLGSQLHFVEERGDFQHHEVLIEKGTQLFEVLYSYDKLKVNSRHHQAVKDLGESLRVAARSEEGTVEAVESTEKKFVIGVQWHPEALVEDRPCFRELFGSLILTARENAPIGLDNR